MSLGTVDNVQTWQEANEVIHFGLDSSLAASPLGYVQQTIGARARAHHQQIPHPPHCLLILSVCIRYMCEQTCRMLMPSHALQPCAALCP